jgi:hypothetical protein
MPVYNDGMNRKQEWLANFIRNTGKSQGQVARDTKQDRAIISHYLGGNRNIGWVAYGHFNKAYRVSHPYSMDKLHQILSEEN